MWEQLISEVFSRDELGRTPFSTVPDIGSDESDGLAIFNAIQTLYLSRNQPRDRQIAERITNLHPALSLVKVSKSQPGRLSSSRSSLTNPS